MKHKKIIALLLAAAIMGSLVGCKAGSKSGNGQPSDGEFTPPSFETEAPIQSNAQQSVGKVTAINGTKITVELGELKSRTPGDGGNGGNRERPDGNSGNKKERPSDFTRPSGDGNGNSRRGFGYTFNATGGNATYDLSGLTQITIENDEDDTPDTVEEIKTGDVVVVEVDKDGKVTSLTVKSLSGRSGSRSGSGGNGKRTGSRDGNGNGNGKRKSRNGDSDDA